MELKQAVCNCVTLPQHNRSFILTLESVTLSILIVNVTKTMASTPVPRHDIMTPWGNMLRLSLGGIIPSRHWQ